LIALHLEGMRETSPPESVHAFDIDQLRGADVTFWSVWVHEEIAGCGALKQLGARRGELKSMRVADKFLRRGVGRTILEHLMREAGSARRPAPCRADRRAEGRVARARFRAG
jgi:putative acetyltransferase